MYLNFNDPLRPFKNLKKREVLCSQWSFNSINVFDSTILQRLEVLHVPWEVLHDPWEVHHGPDLVQLKYNNNNSYKVILLIPE